MLRFIYTNISQIIWIASSVLTLMVVIKCGEEMIMLIESSFIKLKKLKADLEGKNQELEKEICILRNSENKYSEEESVKKLLNEIADLKVKETTNYSNSNYINITEINYILVKENKKLLVRCDMLETEIEKYHDILRINNPSIYEKSSIGKDI